MENDPDWPDFFFNSAFIINPQGKIILNYRKANVSFGLNAHDIWKDYRDPITGKHDAFPVVDTKIGRLSCMICGDTAIPEIPRIFAFKGAEVLCRLSSGYSWEFARQTLRVRANDNTMYVVAENWAARAITFHDIGTAHIIDSIDTERGGGSMIIGYNGNIIAEANGTAPQLVIGTINIESLRKARESWKSVAAGTGSFIPYTRTEFYRPYYNKTIFPPNQYFKQGPMEHPDDESVEKRRQMAIDNYRKMWDFYSEDDIR
jgi:predicted amidohydrolase